MKRSIFMPKGTFHPYNAAFLVNCVIIFNKIFGSKLRPA